MYDPAQSKPRNCSDGNIHFVRKVKVLQRRKGRKNRVCKTMIIANKS